MQKKKKKKKTHQGRGLNPLACPCRDRVKGSGTGGRASGPGCRPPIKLTHSLLDTPVAPGLPEGIQLQGGGAAEEGREGSSGHGQLKVEVDPGSVPADGTGNNLSNFRGIAQVHFCQESRT